MPTLEIAIGPEGGWAPSEEALFDANGWRAASLGPRILRAETAAIAALAVVGFLPGVVRDYDILHSAQGFGHFGYGSFFTACPCRELDSEV